MVLKLQGPQNQQVRGVVKPRLLGSTLTVADSVALNGVLTSSQVTLALVV